MSKVREFFEAIKEGTSAVLDAAYSPAMQHFVAHGAHEASAALFNGSAFVMYPRGSHDDHQVEQPAPEQEQGMGM